MTEPYAKINFNTTGSKPLTNSMTMQKQPVLKPMTRLGWFGLLYISARYFTANRRLDEVGFFCSRDFCYFLKPSPNEFRRTDVHTLCAIPTLTLSGLIDFKDSFIFMSPRHCVSQLHCELHC